jgi:hypothetical protein
VFTHPSEESADENKDDPLPTFFIVNEEVEEVIYDYHETSYAQDLPPSEFIVLARAAIDEIIRMDLKGKWIFHAPDVEILDETDLDDKYHALSRLGEYSYDSLGTLYRKMSRAKLWSYLLPN